MNSSQKIDELEEAINDILNLATGWVRPMSEKERLEKIRVFGLRALEIVRREAVL